VVWLLAAPWSSCLWMHDGRWWHNALKQHWLVPVSCHLHVVHCQLRATVIGVSDTVADVEMLTFVNVDRCVKSEHIETVFSFSVASYRSCKNLWKSCVEYHTFLCSRQCKQTTTSWMTDGQKQDALDLRYRSVRPSVCLSQFVAISVMTCTV